MNWLCLKPFRTGVRSHVCRSNGRQEELEDKGFEEGKCRMYRTLSIKDLVGGMVLLATGLMYLL